MRYILIFFTALVSICSAASDSIRHEVVLETNEGNIRIALYNETPLHRDNFMKLVREGFYDGLLFHRVIYRFMIQTGDSASRNAPEGKLLGLSSEGYKVPAEIRYPELFHKRGAVAAAREGDDTNPSRASSASQFYIVYGRRYNDAMLDEEQQKLDKRTGGKVKLTSDVREAYKTKGGVPSLDGQYTVFGEVIEGIGIVEKIQMCDTDDNDRPVTDVVIKKAYVVK